MSALLAKTLQLPCGVEIPNRFCKAAMTEGLADPWDQPGDALESLYTRWSKGGAGLLISGNIMIDRRYLERGGNVVLENDVSLDKLKRFANAGTCNGNQFWVQLNHPGRQCNRMVNSRPISPSNVTLKIAGNFGRPKEMTQADILEVIERFANTAALCQQAGFTGVQIHSAHGYLGSQFLSPITNRRTDSWGGSLENRARFLMETLDRVRERVGPQFPVSVKLNSADFQRGGFSFEESIEVAKQLSAKKIDLLEISGGTYEKLVFMDNSENPERNIRDSTRHREAFFLDYADAIRDVVDVPIMITGGFRTVLAMENALSEGSTDMLGIARPFCIDPDLPDKVLRGDLEQIPAAERGLYMGQGLLGPASRFATIRAINNQGQAAWFYQQIIALSQGRDVQWREGMPRSVLAAFLKHLVNELKINLRRKQRA